jgi:catechol 2,3-dioxygenase-like lactoylglutathione lyase family enzyme
LIRRPRFVLIPARNGAHVRIEELKVGPVIPVSDMAASRAFYEGQLGLRGEPAPGGYALRAGAETRIFLLDGTDYAGRAGWPLASFQTDDLEATVADLRQRGVDFEMMGDGDPFQTDERGIADVGNVLLAWIRDPDNQVISLFQLT